MELYPLGLGQALCVAPAWQEVGWFVLGSGLERKGFAKRVHTVLHSAPCCTEWKERLGLWKNTPPHGVRAGFHRLSFFLCRGLVGAGLGGGGGCCVFYVRTNLRYLEMVFLSFFTLFPLRRSGTAVIGVLYALSKFRRVAGAGDGNGEGRGVSISGQMGKYRQTHHTIPDLPIHPRPKRGDVTVCQCKWAVPSSEEDPYFVLLALYLPKTKPRTHLGHARVPSLEDHFPSSSVITAIVLRQG